MSRQIAAAIFLDGIFNRRSALYRFEHQSPNIDVFFLEIPNWFIAINRVESFQEKEPIPPDKFTRIEKKLLYDWIKDPVFDLPAHLKEFGDTYQAWEWEKDKWELTQKLRLLRKWVFWCADFCDLNRDLSLQSNVGDE